MSEFVELDAPKKGVTDEGGYKVLLQLQEWYQARIDKINWMELKLKNGASLTLNDSEVEDPQFIRGFRSGLLIAVELMGSLPIKLGEPTFLDDEEVDDDLTDSDLDE